MKAYWILFTTWLKRIFDIPIGNPHCKRKMYPSNASSGYILAWQIMEKDLKVPYFQSTKPPNKIQAIEIANYVRRNIKYVTDKDNWGKWEYWPTSKEVLDRKKEDCDGQAIAMWRLLMDAGFPKDDIGMVIVHGHMFCCIHISDEDFWVLDNGYLSYRTMLASKLFPIIKKGKEIYPLVGFNMHSWWKYTDVK